jgi:Methyltransferase FkbM domain
VLQLWGTGDSITGSAYPRAADTIHPPAECPMVDLGVVLTRAGGTAGLLKIDTEGAEADILEGGRDVLRSVAQCVGEYHEDRVTDVVPRCQSAFEQSGFTFARTCSRRCGPMFHARRID